MLALFRDRLVELADARELRVDVPTEELATFCLHALTAAGSPPSEDAAGRFVDVTHAALRPAE